MSTNSRLTGVVAEHVRAVNTFDVDAIIATFADGAYINDARREIRGRDAIRRFVTKEIVGDHVTMDVTEVIQQHGQTIVRAVYDGIYDKTNLARPADPHQLLHRPWRRDRRADHDSHATVAVLIRAGPCRRTRKTPEH